MSNKKKTIALASDHAGFILKKHLLDFLVSEGYSTIDLGTKSEERVDYPDYGFLLSDTIAKGEADFGIGICGSGIGINIALNRNTAVRAALCQTPEMAKLSREHNNANVLALGERLITQKLAIECVKIFLSTAFEGGRHELRVKKLGEYRGFKKDKESHING